MNIEELNKKLEPQGLKVVWVGVDGSPDHKMRPIPVDERVSNLEDAISTLALLLKLFPKQDAFLLHNSFPEPVDCDSSSELRSLFAHYGSDKGRVHAYDALYSN